MATLSLNTTIGSSHKDDFYSTTNEFWIKVNNVHGNYFSTESNCPGGNLMEFFVKIFGTTVWKSIGGCSDFNYYYSPCYQYCVWDFINARYYDPNDVDNLKHIDKIAVTYLGLRNESFVNRCHVNVTAVDNNNLPLSGVRVLDSEDSLTNNEGLFSFPVFTSGGVAVNIIGILPGYICTSGCGVIPILEATSDKDIIITLTKCEQPICNMIIGD